jgi:hypothetical protein
LFDFLDDPRRLGAHMSRASWMMAGGRMDYLLDEQQGRAVGSMIRLSGRAIGITLAVEETVIERVRPRRKVWQTVAEPRLLVIGAYRMGFDIEPRRPGSGLAVFIDYALPLALAARSLGRLFGGVYARWCVGRMAADAVHHFVGQQQAPNATRRGA